MAGNRVYRVYPDEETMLRIYARRLRMSDRQYEERRPENEAFVARYENMPVTGDLAEDGHRVVVAEGLSLIDTMFSSMTAVDVQFLCKAIGQGTEEQAIAATDALNHFVRDSKVLRRAKRAIKDALIVDIGVVKVYYDYIEDVAVKDRPDAAVKAEIVELMGRGASAEEAAAQVEVNEPTTVVLRDRVCLDYVPYDMVRWDPSAKQVEDVRWWAQYTKMPVGEVSQNPTWRTFVEDRYGVEEGRRKLDSIEGDTTIDVGLAPDYFAEIGADQDNDDARITIVEMWDLETGLVTVFPKDKTDLVLYQWQNPLMYNVDLEDRSPFKPLIVRTDPDDFTGIGDMRAIYPSLEELDEYRSNIATFVTRTIPKLIGPDRALTPAGKKALESATWGEYVGLAEGHTGNEITPLDPPKFPQEAIQVIERIQASMREATGVNEVLRGVFPQGRKTATETELVSDSGQRRQAERRSALVEWYEDIGRTALQLMQVYYDRERILRLTDDFGQDFAWSWDKADIALDADIQVSITPKEDLTRQERAQRAYQAMNLALALPETDRSQVLRWFYRELGLSEKEIRHLVKTPEEAAMEQQAAQLAALSVSPARPGGPAGLQIQQPIGRG